MSKKLLLQLRLPVLLVAAVIAVWIVWAQIAWEAKFDELPQGVSAVLLALAALAVLRSFRDDAGHIPLAAWAVAALLIVIAVTFFFSSVVGILGLVALFALAAAIFGSS